ncbi:MAG: M48 family metalloprotease [Azospirillaceae bacterium]
MHSALRPVLVAISLALSLILATVPAQAQGLRLIRDAEIESYLHALCEPLFRAAGLSPASIDIYLVEDNASNAFVAGGQNIFIHTGLLMQVQSAGELLGILAHETGHIAGGHLAMSIDQMERTEALAIISMLAGGAAAAASGRGDVAAGTILSGQSMAERSMLAYSRNMEGTADQAALNYLDAVGYSAEGLLAYLTRIVDEELLPASRQSEYVRTHPISYDRLEQVRRHVESSPDTGRPLPGYVEDQFQRMRAKLIGYENPALALNLYGGGDSIYARYAQAIAHYRRGDVTTALSLVDGLVSSEPNNGYFWELLGDIRFDYGQMAEARQAYERAHALLPGAGLIRIALARTLMDSGTAGDLAHAIRLLEGLTQTGQEASPFTYRLLGTAYGRNGDMGLAALALAEEAIRQGDRTTATQQAQRAIDLLPTGTPGAIRAQDLMRDAERE